MKSAKSRCSQKSSPVGKIAVFAVSSLSLGCFILEQKADASIFAQFGSASGQRQVMTPLRRVGLLPVGHNIVEARKTLTDQTTLKGILAQPLRQEEFSLKLNTQVKAVADASGRFWTMDAIAEEVMSGRSASGAQMSSFQRAQLVRDYDLDAWLKTEVYFTADHTSVRLAIVEPQGRQVIAREDVLLPFGADWDALANAFAQALGRMSDTIGHDGRVVFENNDLVGIDFGLERGVAPGHRLKAGLVLQDLAHPQTGEVLRYQRTTLVELEVIEAKQGASLCRKVVLDPELMKQAEARFGVGPEKKAPLLVWRDDFKKSEPVWKSGADNGRADAGGAGFSRRGGVGESSSKSAMSLSQSSSKSNEKPFDQKPESVQPTQQMAMSSGTNFFSAPRFSSRHAGGPGAAIELGAGVSEGTLQLSRGPVTTSLPSMIVNQFWIKDGFKISPDWEIHYGADYTMFSGDLEGSKLVLRAGMMAAEELYSIPELPLRWGAEGQLSSGTVKTTRSKKTFDALELSGVLKTQRALDAGWVVGGDLKPSVTGLLAGVLAYEVALNVQPGLAPKGLGVEWKLLDDGDHWTEWSLGVTWKLGAAE